MKPILSPAELLGVVGQRFGELTMRSVPTRDDKKRLRACAKCSCGVEKTVDFLHVFRGRIVSCGHLKTEKFVAMATTHGESRHGNLTGTYQSWRAAKGRCEDPNNAYYAKYGGRGIKMCARWRKSFENFRADMGARPDGMTLDRYPDNGGNYEPGNCRWATRKQQSANRGVGKKASV